MHNTESIKAMISGGSASLGIELGSTRIKGVLIAPDGQVLASGSYEWENQLIGGIWTYSMDAVWQGVAACYAALKQDVLSQYGITLTQIGSMGVSAMMHGYLAFDKQGNLLVPFRTWRNTMTGEAAAELTELLAFNIPQRWSVAHLYQAILGKEAHVRDIAFVTTLAGYVHYMLTGEKVLGVGDASGMFPIDSESAQFDTAMLAKLENKLAPLGLGFKVSDVLPCVLCAGENAGTLTAAGAKLLDPQGDLEPGVVLCPPEGDAGTGMAATNSIAPRTGNVSAGTSVFAMVVLEKSLSKVYPQLDMVTTPTGMPVAMVHCNNCTSDLNAWVDLFGEFAKEMGIDVDANALFGTLYRKALEGDADCGGLLSYPFFSGEHNVGLKEGRPLFVRTPDSRFTLANFMRSHLYASLAVLKTGMDVLLGEEGVKIDCIFGHGGLFKTRGVGQRVLAGAINTPVTVMDTAGEGGAWGIALLAAYVKHKQDCTLEKYLSGHVFAGQPSESVQPDAADVAGYENYISRFMAGLDIEKKAIETLV